jgi:hypothetical protein
LSETGLTLRSGGAIGSDQAFEKGCDFVNGKKEIWLPWSHFNYNRSIFILENPIPLEVTKIALTIYNRWESSSDSVKKLHARNVYQILGFNLMTPVDFVVCWTDRNESDSGGTMFAVKLALIHNIPVYNLYNFTSKELFKIYLRTI